MRDSKNNLSITQSVNGCRPRARLSALASSTVAAPARRPAAMSSSESPTMMSRAPPSASSHWRAMCRMPAGDGLGGLKARVTMGANSVPGRCVASRWLTCPPLSEKRLDHDYQR